MVVRVSCVWFHISRFMIGTSSAQKHRALKDRGFDAVEIIKLEELIANPF